MKKILILIICITSFAAASESVFDLSTIKEGEYDTVSWKGTPVFIFHRTKNQIEYLSQNSQRGAITAPISSNEKMYGIAKARSLMMGNEANRDGLRSLQEKWLVVVGITPDMGVVLRVNIEEGVMVDPSDSTLYDLTGRVIGTGSSKKDLSIPHYKILENKLTIFDGKSEEEVRDSVTNFEGSLEEKISYAISNKQFNILNKILEQNPALIKNAKINLQVLLAVSIYGEKEVLETAINNGANLNVVFKDGATPLNMALVLDNLEVAELLFRSGAATQKICDTENPLLCSTPTLTLAKSIEGTEEVVRSWMQY